MLQANSGSDTAKAAEMLQTTIRESDETHARELVEVRDHLQSQVDGLSEKLAETEAGASETGTERDDLRGQVEALTRKLVMLQVGVGFVSHNKIQRHTIWYGMVWYGMVWYGMVWYGMVW